MRFQHYNFIYIIYQVKKIIYIMFIARMNKLERTNLTPSTFSLKKCSMNI